MPVPHPDSQPSAQPVDPAAPPIATPYWWEDPDLAAAVAEVEEFAGAAGWDEAPQMFALVRTSELLRNPARLVRHAFGRRCVHPDRPGRAAGGRPVRGAVPDLLARRGDRLRAGAGDRGAAAVRGRRWRDPPAATPTMQRPCHDVEITAEQAAAHPDRAEARLAAGVLRGTKGGACVLRVRGKDDATPLRGADLAPNLLSALQATFDD